MIKEKTENRNPCLTGCYACILIERISLFNTDCTLQKALKKNLSILKLLKAKGSIILQLCIIQKNFLSEYNNVLLKNKASSTIMRLHKETHFIEVMLLIYMICQPNQS